jgi:hypothetical protein
MTFPAHVCVFRTFAIMEKKNVHVPLNKYEFKIVLLVIKTLLRINVDVKHNILDN